MTATRIAASAGGGSTFAGVYDVTSATYGATGNGSTDDTTAVQAAITAAKTAGGTVYFPPGIYKITSTLICDNNPGKTLRLTGPGGRAHYGSANVAAVIRYTGTGTALQCFSVLAFELDHLKIEATNVLHTGDIIDVDGNPHAADCQLWEIHHCAISTATNNTRSNIRLNKAIIGSVHHCHLTGGQNPLRIGDPGGSYVVSVYIHDNTYNFGQDAHILVGSGDGENITIYNEVFEDMPTNGAIHGNSCQLYGFTLKDCWFGDASAAGTWIKGLITSSNAQPGIIAGCRMADPGGLTGRHFDLTGNWLLTGNGCEGGTIYDPASPSTLTLTAINNDYNTTGAIFTGARPTNYVSLNNACPGSAKETDQLPGRIGFGNHGVTLTVTGGNEELLLGATTGSLQSVNGGAMYTYYAGGNLFATVMQAPTSPAATTREVQIAAGDPPVPVIRVMAAKLGFYNTAPVSRTAAYTLNAGATTRNLASGGTTANVEQTLRQLITDLQGYGLLQ